MADSLTDTSAPRGQAGVGQRGQHRAVGADGVPACSGEVVSSPRKSSVTAGRRPAVARSPAARRRSSTAGHEPVHHRTGQPGPLGHRRSRRRAGRGQQRLPKQIHLSVHACADAGLRRLVRIVMVVGATKVSLIARGETQRCRLSTEPALSLVPEARAPPNGCWPTTAPVGLSLT